MTPGVLRSRFVDTETTDQRLWLMANTQLIGFRCIMGNLSFQGMEFVNITPEQAAALGIKAGDELRVVPLSKDN